MFKFNLQISTLMLTMQMYFHGGMTETILFECWKITEETGLIGSMVAIFFLAFFYEALKFYREHLYRHSFKTVEINTASVPVENGGGAVKETHKTVQYVKIIMVFPVFILCLLAFAWSFHSPLLQIPSCHILLFTFFTFHPRQDFLSFGPFPCLRHSWSDSYIHFSRKLWMSSKPGLGECGRWWW